MRLKSRRLNVWSAYRVGMRTKTGGDGSLKSVIKQVAKQPKRLSWTLSPIDFLRYREFDFALRAIQAGPSPRAMLDLSSPKLLPLTLACEYPKARVVATDILEREVNWVSNKAAQLRLNNVHAHVEDARQLTFADSSFDLITSISVFEHIAPEIDGDLPAISELSRVLAPGGRAIITVPFAKKYLADYQNGDVYERTGSTEPIFFQRFYDEPLLRRNFVEHSGLNPISISFVAERGYSDDPRKRIAHWINCSPRQNALFAPMFPLLSHLFLSPPRPLNRCRKPYIACLVLEKPTVTGSLAA